MRGNLRIQLTVVFGLLFFAAAFAVLGGTMILVENSMNYSLDLVFGSVPDRDATKEVIMTSMRSNLLAKGGLTVLAVGVLATTGGWLVAGRLLRPLNQITETARAVAGRTIHRRISLDAPPGEVKTLADSFDSMLDRLDQAFAGQSRFISNAAHELKTPLVLNRTLVEVAMLRRDSPPEVHQLGENLLAVNARHERLIDALLTLARAQEAIAEPVPVDLGELATLVLERVTEQAAALDITVKPVLSGAVAVGDPILLEQVLQNLLDNAIRHNEKGGWVELRVHRTLSGVQVVVTNTGARIALHEIPLLFEPFRRLNDRVGSATGSGLGLSIVRAVARAHGGDAAAAPRQGGGLVVRVTVPVYAHQSGRDRHHSRSDAG